MLNLNCNSGCVSKDREGFLVEFFAVTALSDFVLKKRCKDADVLAYSDHRTARIGYKLMKSDY